MWRAPAGASKMVSLLSAFPVGELGMVGTARALLSVTTVVEHTQHPQKTATGTNLREKFS